MDGKSAGGPRKDEESCAEREDLLMDHLEPPAAKRRTETTESPARPPRANMPLILSISVPGLGHALYGAPAWGVAAIILSLALLLVCIYAFVVSLFHLLGGQPFLKPLVILGALLAYGLVFTGLVVWDARDLEDRDGRVTGAMHLAIISCALVILGGLWLIL